MEIKNIEEIIPSLLTDGRKFMWYEHQQLLAPGENYGSTMMQVKIVLANTKGKKEIIPCVAKLVPPSPFIWKMFNIPVTFKKEIRVYDKIIPTLNDFGMEHGIENILPFFPDYIGSRISLDPKSNEVDHDAVLLLKNLKEEGYDICDRFVGFDRATAMMLIKDLATFHATGIAYKLAKPEEFQEKLMPYLNKGAEPEFNPDVLKAACDAMVTSLSTNKDTAPLIDSFVSKFTNLENAFVSDCNEPFATAVHLDLWTNNMMVKCDGNKPISTKFVDFQIMEYGNPARDLIFLLYSSVQVDELVNVDEYIKVYHDQLIEVLKKLDCDTTKFTMVEFKKEIDAAASNTEFIHVVFMLQPIYTKKDKAVKPEDMKDESAILQTSDVLHDNYHRRLQFVVKDFADRKWL